jgi:scyllo-inositol 2-dehydrogenase (NADP+)
MQAIITGVVGYGFSGRVFHCPFVHAHSDFHLKTVVSRHSDEPLKDYPYIQIARTYEDLLNDQEIELVIITTPSHLHFEQAKMALEKGKHVLVEKPYTSTYEEALILNKLAEENKLFISAYQNRRYDGDFLTLCELKKEGFFEQVYEGNVTWDRLKKVESSSWKGSGLRGADLIFDLGSHLLDQVLTLFGEPIECQSLAKKVREGTKIRDWFTLLLDYGDYAIRVKASLGAFSKEERYSYQTSKGGLVFHKMGEQEGQLLAGMKPDDEAYGDDA